MNRSTLSQTTFVVGWLLGIAAALLAILPGAAVAANSITVTVPNLSVPESSSTQAGTFDVTVVTTGSSLPEVSDFAVNLQISPASGVDFTGGAATTADPYIFAGQTSGPTVNPPPPSGTTIEATDFATTPPTLVNGDGLLAVNYSVPANTSGTFNLTIVTTGSNPTALDDQNANSIPFTVQNPTPTLTVVPSAVYWNGGLGAGWNTLSGTSYATNWSTTAAGGADAHALPGTNTDVFFTTNSGGANLSTTLSSSLSIKGLTFTSAATNPVSISGNTLTLGADGLTVQSGAAAATINSAVTLSSNQSWTVSGSNPLTINGTLSLTGQTLTKAGNGTLRVDAPPSLANGSSLNVSAGTLQFDVTSGSATVGSNVTATVSGGTLQLTGPVSPLSNVAVIVSGGTLDASAVANTIGSLNVGGGGTLNVGIGNLLTSTGAASFGGTLNIGGTISGSPSSVELIAYSGSPTGTFSTTTSFPNYALFYNSGQLDLQSIASGLTTNAGSIATFNSASGNTTVNGPVQLNGGQVQVNGGSTNSVTITGQPTLNSGSVAVNAGTLTFDNSVAATGTGAVSVTVATAATLQLAGSASAFTSAVNITNNGSTASGGGLLVTGANQSVGVVSGQVSAGSGPTTYSGDTIVGNGMTDASLSVTQILQNTLTINAGSTVTILPSGSGISSQSVAGIGSASASTSAAAPAVSIPASSAGTTVPAPVAANSSAAAASPSAAATPAAATSDPFLSVQSVISSGNSGTATVAASPAALEPIQALIASIAAAAPASTASPDALTTGLDTASAVVAVAGTVSATSLPSLGDPMTASADTTALLDGATLMAADNNAMLGFQAADALDVSASPMAGMSAVGAGMPAVGNTNSVPEPSTLVLLLLGGAIPFGIRRAVRCKQAS